MAERKLSIEVGERLVKACVTGKKGRLPAQSFTFLAPAGAVADGQINDPEALAQALCAELEQRGIKLRKAVFLACFRQGRRARSNASPDKGKPAQNTD